MLSILFAGLAIISPLQAPVRDMAPQPVLCQSLFSVITLDKITEMFQQIRDNAHWDTSKPLRWGYYFEDVSRDKLQQVADALVAKGYALVEIRPAGALQQLHLEKIETHTPQSLVDRNGELAELATRICIMRYDGFDVGPVKQP
jgi:hypothetical protein